MYRIKQFIKERSRSKQTIQFLHIRLAVIPFVVSIEISQHLHERCWVYSFGPSHWHIFRSQLHPLYVLPPFPADGQWRDLGPLGSWAAADTSISGSDPAP